MCTRAGLYRRGARLSSNKVAVTMATRQRGHDKEVTPLAMSKDHPLTGVHLPPSFAASQRILLACSRRFMASCQAAFASPHCVVCERRTSGAVDDRVW